MENLKDFDKEKRQDSIRKGIIAGIVPHIGCILFIVFTLLGVTSASLLFKRFLLLKWTFPALIVFSFLLAGISSFFYLRRNCCVNKARYLAILFGSVIMINLLMFFVVFPLTANISGRATKNSMATFDSSLNQASLTLKVDIPCSGHASLITDELKKIDGVGEVKFRLPNYFDITYDSAKTSEQKITSLEIFNEYKATLIKTDTLTKQVTQQNNYEQDNPTNPAKGICGYGCCGGGT